MKRITIDVVVPSVRLDSAKLASLLKLDVPANIEVHYYLVLDGSYDPPPELEASSRNVVTVIENGDNMGAHKSRNRGFEAGSGQYVLFLDDDVEPAPDLLHAYARAIEEDPTAPGFVGVTRFPTPPNSFTRGVLASDILTFFGLAETREWMAWGPTANLMVRREAVGDVRFSHDFPKGGGGEDIDYCLRIAARTGKWLNAVPGAIVVHPWWDNGRRHYLRFARWAYGDSRIPELHPAHRFRNFPNMIETIVIGVCVAAIASVLGAVSPIPIGLWVGCVITLEFVVEGLRLKTRGRFSLAVILEATFVRLSNDLGRLLGNLRRGHVMGFTERFDYFITRESSPYELKVALTKFLLFVCSALFVFWT